MKSLEELIRPEIKALNAYVYDDVRSKDKIFLNHNESPYNSPMSRFPDPYQKELKKALSDVRGITEKNIFLGNGTMDVVDIIYRSFLRKGIDNVVAIEPTRRIYRRCAQIYGIEYRGVLLNANFQISAEKLLASTDETTKVIWLCSPNNPTGNSLLRDEIIKTIIGFDGLVVVDEAYSDFSTCQSLRREINKYENLIVLDTFSTSFSCASIRLAMAYASKDIIDIFSKVSSPYNINQLTQEFALKILDNSFAIEKSIRDIIAERGRMVHAFNLLPFCDVAYRTDANFFLAKMKDASTIYNYLLEDGIIVHNCSSESLCSNCLRITIGTTSENTKLLSRLRKF